MWNYNYHPAAFLALQLVVLTMATNVTTNLDKLHEDLLDGYKATVPSNGDQPVELKLMMHLHQILKLDGQTQVLEVSAQLCMSWTEVHFVWDPEDYGGQGFTTFSASDAWVPRIGLINSVGVVRDEHWEQFFPVMVRHDGFIFWSVTSVLSTSCALDMRSFPFDAQRCVIEVGSLVHGTGMVNMTPSEEEINLEFYTESKQFYILKKSVVGTVRVAQAMPKYGLSNVEFELVLLRKPVYYVLNLLIPCLVLSVLASLSFMIPVDAGEKLSISITVLLAFSVFLIVLGDITPRTSEQVPLLSIYLATIMVITGMSLFCTVATLNLHHSEPSRPLPSWLHNILILRLGKLLRMSDAPPAKASRKAGSKQILVESETKPGKGGKVVPPDGIHMQTTLGSHQMAAIDSVAKDVRKMAQSMIEEEEEEERGKQWHLAARILDRLFLYIYLVVIIVSTVSMVIIYPIIKM